MSTPLSLFIADDSGQDLVEYALLTTFISLAVIAVFGVLSNSISAAYGVWNTSANNLWASPNPAGP